LYRSLSSGKITKEEMGRGFRKEFGKGETRNVLRILMRNCLGNQEADSSLRLTWICGK
jgi:hypothetical protein